MGTYGDSDILIDTRLKCIGVAIEQLFTLSLRDGRIDIIALSCFLAGMSVADSSHTLSQSQNFNSKLQKSETYYGVIIEVGPEPLEAGDEINTVGT